jgi:hypothetical protein
MEHWELATWWAHLDRDDTSSAIWTYSVFFIQKEHVCVETKLLSSKSSSSRMVWLKSTTSYQTVTTFVQSISNQKFQFAYLIIIWLSLFTIM